MRSSALLSLLALATLGAAPAIAQDGPPPPPSGGWGPNGWSGAAPDAPLPPGHPPVTAGERLPEGHPPVAAGPMRGPDGRPVHGPDGPPMHGPAGPGPHHGMMGMGRGPSAPPSYFYVQPNGPEPGYYYVPGPAPQPYGYGYGAGTVVYTNPQGPVMVAPGTTVIVKVTPGTTTRTVTEEWVPAHPKRHWGSKARCRCK